MRKRIEVIPSIYEAVEECGIETLEGRIGPLLKGEMCGAHYILMPPGLYCEEHAHDSESIIFTVRGQWVLVNEGKRTVMEEGSLFRFLRGVPTGYEVPFDKPALILIFKGEGTPEREEFFIHLEELARRLEEARAEGKPFNMSELPDEHPAKMFAHGLVI